jgi:hypothetical protein
MAEKPKDEPEPRRAGPQEPPETAAAEATAKPSGGQEADRRQLEALRRKLREKFHTS